MALLDDDENGFDEIDDFKIIINDSVFCFNKSNPLTINGTWGVGRITLAFYSLIINPTSCDTKPIPTIASTSSLCEGNLASCCLHKYIHTYIDIHT